MIKVVAAVIVFFASLNGLAIQPFYVPDQQYRFPASDPRCKLQNLCSSEPNPGFTLNFVEVRDKVVPGNGMLFDSNQLEEAKTQIDKARIANPGRKVIVFIYVHGWHNNASEGGSNTSRDCSSHLFKGDVAKFRNCGLKVIADNYPSTSSASAPAVVGIYLAWHGTDFAWPPFNIIPSYPLRRGAARRVGLTEMATVLRSIFDVIQSHRGSYFVIAMGHSFGARVLEAADEVPPDEWQKSPDPDHSDSGIIRKLATGKTLSKSTSSEEKLPVDLIFYVNAATSHAESRRTVAEWRELCIANKSNIGCSKNPLYFAVSSRADWITAIVMPIANVVFFSPLTDNYHIISAANTPWMQTHKIPQQISRGAVSIPPTVILPPNGFCFAVPETVSTNFWYKVVPKRAETSMIFWDMNSDHWIASVEGLINDVPLLRRTLMPHWVISSHGDVWNSGVFNMVRAVADRRIYKDVPNRNSCSQDVRGQAPLKH